MIYHLQSRHVFRVTGADAADFLQNTLTNDIRKISLQAPLQYNLLLSPQGQVLHEMFVMMQAEGDYLIDTHAPRHADLLRRLTLFKLRAKVDITPCPDTRVYAIMQGEGGHADPRSADLGRRLYTTEQPTSDSIRPEDEYTDICINKTVPLAAAIRFEKDFVHDLGLQNFHAIAWDKGCFIGQEVAARVEHRGLAKKGLFSFSADQIDMENPAITLANGIEAGEIRLSNRAGSQGLAVIKKMAIESGEALLHAGKAIRV